MPTRVVDTKGNVFWKLLFSPRVRIPALVLLMVGLAFGTLSTFVPLFIRSAGVDLNAGLFYTAAAIASFSVRLVTGRASDRYGRGLFITISLVFYTASMLLLWAATGDFTRNAYLSIFTCPSSAKGGKISTIVPLVSHVDHNEHSVGIIVTEHGVADLRGKSPTQRANEIIEKCAHPDFRAQLKSYMKIVEGAHTPHTLSKAFGMHEQFERTGDMRNCDWTD